jgi:hypothetical protein
MPEHSSSPIHRRAFLKGSAVGAAGAAIATPFHALLARAEEERDSRDRRLRRERSCSPDYGPLAPVTDHTTGLPLLHLPDGFEYLTFGWAGDLLSITPS